MADEGTILQQLKNILEIKPLPAFIVFLHKNQGNFSFS